MDTKQISYRQIRNKQGELNTNVDSLLAMAGYGPKAERFIREGNFVWVKGIGGEYHPDRLGEPFRLSDVKGEVHSIVTTARVEIAKNLRSFKRHVKLSEWDAIQLWKALRAKDTEIIHCKVGETVKIPRNSFASGGSWNQWEIFGQITHDDLYQEEILVTFDQGPAAVLTAAGDDLNGGRTDYRKVYVAE